jgi:hypothetical protein
MTEQEWLHEQRWPQKMAWALRNTSFARTKTGKRKLRLFACACCRLVWELLSDTRLQQAVEVAERFAEAQAGKQELATVHARAQKVRKGMMPPDAADARAICAVNMAASAAHPQAISAALETTAHQPPLAGYSPEGKQGEQLLCDLLRCVVGNPFRPLSPKRAWLTPTVTGLARAAYDERQLPSGELDLHRLAVLADALEEAGTPGELVAHLRGPGPHCRGCHVVDLCLGLT